MGPSQVDFEMDDNLTGIVTAQCPLCESRLKTPIAQLGQQAELTCPCGGTIALDRNELLMFQRMVNNLREAARGLTAWCGSTA